MPTLLWRSIKEKKYLFLCKMLIHYAVVAGALILLWFLFLMNISVNAAASQVQNQTRNQIPRLLSSLKGSSRAFFLNYCGDPVGSSNSQVYSTSQAFTGQSQLTKQSNSCANYAVVIMLFLALLSLITVVFFCNTKLERKETKFMVLALVGGVIAVGAFEAYMVIKVVSHYIPTKPSAIERVFLSSLSGLTIP